MIKPKKQQSKEEPTYNFIPKVRDDDPFDDSQYSKGTVQVDWEKRKLPEEIEQEENSEDDQLDFAELLQMPASVSGHFFFSTEKNWESESSSIINSKAKYFHLDTKVLNSCLKSIPFNERQGYENQLFSDFQLKSMKFTAEEQEKLYNKTCNIEKARKNMSNSGNNSSVDQQVVPSNGPNFVDCSLMLKLPADMPSHLRRGGNDDQPPSPQPEPVQENSQIQQVAAIQPIQSNVVAPKNTPSEKEDIQKWLDDILDE